MVTGLGTSRVSGLVSQDFNNVKVESDLVIVKRIDILPD